MNRGRCISRVNHEMCLCIIQPIYSIYMLCAVCVFISFADDAQLYYPYHGNRRGDGAIISRPSCWLNIYTNDGPGGKEEEEENQLNIIRPSRLYYTTCSAL